MKTLIVMTALALLAGCGNMQTTSGGGMQGQSSGGMDSTSSSSSSAGYSQDSAQQEWLFHSWAD